jgi:NAD(P)-dependent dehydrogenase (short-subunit alcohol dehydrogenase family)
MASRLAGRRILVTGAAGGQGRAVAGRLLDEGALVALSDVAADKLDQAAGDLGDAARVTVCPADVRDEAAVRHAVELAVTSFGGLDGLYNNAGVYLEGRDAPVDRLELEVWESVMAINTTGTFLFCKYAVPALLAADAGVVVNVASTAGHAGDAQCHAYAASKGALIALTLSIARRWGSDGLRAVTLCPGFIETPMVDFAARDPDVAAAIRSATALGRFGRPEEIAAAAAFLLSDDASFLTACTVDVHGGLVK